MSELNYRMLEPAEQPRVLPLLGRCFPDYWEQLAMTAQEMPFAELSFVAENSAGELVAHVGVMDFTVELGEGRTARLAGVASVAVAPEYRGGGVAVRLCTVAARWAEEQGFANMPLFTGLGRVYAACGWRDYANCPPRRWAVPTGGTRGTVRGVAGADLSAEARTRIQSFYEHGTSFPGKVCRGVGREFHGWERIFAEPAWRFWVHDGGYVLTADGAVYEAYGAAEALAELLAQVAAGMTALTVALPESSRLGQQLGWRELGPATRDLLHNEHVMLRDCGRNDAEFKRLALTGQLYFPLADKF